MKTARPVLLLLAIAILAFIGYRRAHPAPKPLPPEPGGPYVLQVRPIPVLHNLALGEFDVPAKSNHEARIAMDEPNMRNARLTGYFSSTSPGIQVMLLDESEHTRFANQSTPSEFLYLSKTATNGTIEAPIPHNGTYYLIFDNSASEAAVKVKADVTVRYETVQVGSQPERGK